MTPKKKLPNKYVVIHGHFYQPPRENPWLEVIQREESAYPYHNWDERITQECYLPNATSRIVDGDERIMDLVNNYAYMNFNFGPTLLSWMKTHSPRVYQALIEADIRALKKFKHGNAIAQAYNHMIMPLANERDKITQVVWGIYDFEHMFNRYPEAMWLPETAIDNATVRVLIEHKMRYVILAPNQALRVRRFGGGEKDWIDVSTGSIDPRKPYRIFWRDKQGKKNEHRFIDAFFYDGGLSQAVAFEKLMTNAPRCADRIEKAFGPDNIGGPRLVHIATDGETYGHHEPFSDMCLAYLLKQELPSRGIEVINYARFLEIRPPAEEAELKPGDDGTGTSWSCAHGVDRWRDDCGCCIGQHHKWNQAWRKPLRETLNWLRDELAALFEQEAKTVFHDPWAARNDYIAVINDRSPETLVKFMDEHAIADSDNLATMRALRLLEMQRQAMLMFTSCGWFFDELSGLETVQLMKYAARAMQLAWLIRGKLFEPDFLNRLSAAKSNIVALGDGADVFNNYVRPYVVTWERIVTQYAITSSFSGQEPPSIYNYTIEVVADKTKRKNKLSCRLAQVVVTCGTTQHTWEGVFLLIRSGQEETHCLIRRREEADDYRRIDRALFGGVAPSSAESLMQQAGPFFGANVYSIRDLLKEEKEEVLSVILSKKVETLTKQYQKIFEDNRGLLEKYAQTGLRIARQLKAPCEIALSNRVAVALTRFVQNEDLSLLEPAGDAVFTAQRLSFDLDLIEAERIVGVYLAGKIHYFRKNATDDEMRNFIQFLTIVQELGIDTKIYDAQNAYYDWLSDIHTTQKKDPLPSWIGYFLTTGDFLQFNLDRFRKKFEL